MGRWRGATFKEYIREELACFSKGMLTSMKTKCEFVNITGNAFNAMMDELINREYKINVTTALAALTTDTTTVANYGCLLGTGGE